MKKTTRALSLIALLLAIVLLLPACNAGMKDCVGPESADGGREIGKGDISYSKRIDSMTDGWLVGEADMDAPASPADVDVADGKDEKEPENTPAIKPGQITASAWNDNQYYNMYRELFLKGQTEEEDGKFVSYLTDNWKLSTQNRVVVTVTHDGAPVAGAVVTSEGAGVAITDARGVAYLFPEKSGAGKVSVVSGNAAGTADFTEDERDVTVALGGQADKANIIEIMFVIDVTGSMSDELGYLKTELGDVIRRVAEGANGVKINLAFLFYRDDGDDEKFAYEDFRDVTDPDDYKKMQGVLKAENALGGGDYPEALDEALEIAVNKQWMSGNTTKLIFHLYDAPAHDKAANKTRFGSAVKVAAEKGIRICPILASGADTLCEYLGRSEALVTGGTFIYITDDSGIGGGHLDPNLPNAVVEYLNDLLVRVIAGYHIGTFAPPIAWNATVHEHVWIKGAIVEDPDGGVRQEYVCACGETKYEPAE